MIERKHIHVLQGGCICTSAQEDPQSGASPAGSPGGRCPIVATIRSHSLLSLSTPRGTVNSGQRRTGHSGSRSTPVCKGPVESFQVRAFPHEGLNFHGHRVDFLTVAYNAGMLLSKQATRPTGMLWSTSKRCDCVDVTTSSSKVHSTKQI